MYTAKSTQHHEPIVREEHRWLDRRPVALNSGGRSRYAIVLAGGDGTRLQNLIRRWQGQAVPKQFCAFAGDRTMLDHTLERAAALVGPRRVVTILRSGHERFLSRPLPGHVLVQPVSRGTGAAIRLGLGMIRSIDPDADVIVLPSDHFVYPEVRFLETADRALQLAGEVPDRIILLGVRSREPEPDYGWISAGSDRRPGAHLPGDLHQVHRFLEKPSLHVASLLHRSGWYWNTMICAASASFLSECFADTLSELSGRFARFESKLIQARQARFHTSLKRRYLEECFAGLEMTDFSSQVISRISHRLLLLPLQGVDWDDWGRPYRIVKSLERIGRRPNFPLELAEELDCEASLPSAGWNGQAGAVA